MLPFGLYLSVWPNRSNARTWFAQTFWLFDTIFANSSVPEVQVFFFSSKLYEKPTKNSIKLVLKSKRTHSIVLTEASSHFHAVLFFFFVELCSALSRTLGHTSALLAHSVCTVAASKFPYPPYAHHPNTSWRSIRWKEKKRRKWTSNCRMKRVSNG